MAKKRSIEVKPGDVVGVVWADHTGFKNVPLVPGSLPLTTLVTYGEVMHLDPEKEKKIELIQEKQLEPGGDANDACALGTGMVLKIRVYRLVGEVELAR